MIQLPDFSVGIGEVSMGTESYELQLVNRAANGDMVALTVLLTQAQQRLHSHIGRRIPRDLQGTVDADDVLQEAQVEAYRHLHDFQPHGDDSFYRWMATIAIRRLRNAIKKQRAAKRGGGRALVTELPSHLEKSAHLLLDLIASADKTPSRCAATYEAVEAMRAALTELPPDYQRAVQLVYIEGHSVAQAAAEMGRTDRAIHNLCYKAKEHLRGLLGSASRFLSQSG